MANTEKVKTRRELVLENVKHDKVKKLILERNDDTDLPSYPSAQWWYQSSQKERDDLLVAVQAADKNIDDFQEEMKRHWPIRKARNLGSPIYKHG